MHLISENSFIRQQKIDDKVFRCSSVQVGRY
jgi:hypothetical protein